MMEQHSAFRWGCRILHWRLSLVLEVAHGGFLAKVNKHVARTEISPSAIAQVSFRLRHPARNDDALAQAFALIRAIAAQELGLTPHPVQMAGAFHMLRGAAGRDGDR